MYEDFFGLSGAPFKLNPDPKFFFGSRSHNKAMAYLHYGLKQAEGFIVITGPVGAGKSMLIGHLVDQLNRSNVVAAHLLTSNVEPAELLAHILSAFRIVPEAEGRAGQLEAFEDYLFDQMNRGRRVLLVLDEAQNLPRKTLEELRMLSNIDYDGTPLFQVFLVGQPEFRETLSSADMEQLKQRVIASYHLEDLSKEETREYIEHRLSVVGWKEDPVFTESAYDLIHQETKGRPRRINTVCNRTLLFCSIEQTHEIDAGVVTAVIRELSDERLRSNDSKAPKKAEPAAKPKTETKAPEKKPETKPAAQKTQPSKQMAPKNDVVVPFQGGADADSKPEKEKTAPAKAAPKETAASAKKKAPEAKVLKDAASVTKKEASAKKEEAPKSAAEKSKTTKSPETKQPSSKSAATAKPQVQPQPVDPSSLSVFDRLRSQKSGDGAETPAVSETPASKPAEATLTDVASAIKAASKETLNVKTAPVAPASEEKRAKPPSTENEPSYEPAFAEDPVGWKRATVKTLNDAKSDLKAAHSTMSRLRRQLGEIDKRRSDNRSKIVAGLSRAEALLAEIRDAWR